MAEMLKDTGFPTIKESIDGIQRSEHFKNAARTTVDMYAGIPRVMAKGRKPDKEG